MRSARSGEHVVHVGYHKTASTWLQVSVFPKLAGMRYADRLVRRPIADLATAPDWSSSANDLRAVLGQLERLPGGPLLFSDEGLRGSLGNPDATGVRNAERLHLVLPRARILIVVRRQDEMLRSIHGQYVNEGGTRRLRDFVEAEGVEGSHFSLRHLEYDQLVARYVELFGRDRVWVAPYELLRARPERFLEGLCEFLGTEPAPGVSHAWQNRSLSRPALWVLRTWNRLFRVSRFNPDPLVTPLRGGRRVRNLMQRRLDPVIRRVVWDPGRKRDEALLAGLAARFAESNQRLQRFCSHSLGEWGYPLPAVPPREVGLPLAALRVPPGSTRR